jgi:predicted nucleotidyltransferase
MQPSQRPALSISPTTNPVVRGLVELFELVFPARIRGYYLLGSFAEGTAVALSDIDLMVL